jgi:hypothetical protein
MTGQSKEIKKIRLEGFPLEDLTKAGDLIYFDGPFLSLFRNQRGDNYLYYWCDSDQDTNRWLVVRVSDKDLNAYLSKKIPLCNLILERDNPHVLMVDVKDDLTYRDVYLVRPADLPTTYVPSEDSYYEFSPRWMDHVRKEKLADNYAIHLEGEWTLDDLNSLPYNYSKAYAFVYTLNGKPRAISSSWIEHAYQSYPWEGGYSAVNFYHTLKAHIPPGHTPKVLSIQYSSPGWIELDLLLPVALSIRSFIATFIGSGQDGAQKFRAINKGLRDRRLLGPRRRVNREPVEETGDQDFVLSPDDLQFVLEASQSLATVLGIEDLQHIQMLTQNELTALNILRWFYKIIEALARYQTNGKAQY